MTNTALLRGARLAAFGTALMIAAPFARSDALTDCRQYQVRDRQIAGCTEFIRQNPADKKALARAHHHRGNAYQEQQEFDRAIQDYDTAIALKPRFAAAYANRAHAFVATAQKDRARHDFRRAVELDYRFSTILLMGFEIDRARIDREIRNLDGRIQAFPRSSRNYSSRGFYHEMKGREDRAREDYDKSLELEPGLDVGYWFRGLFFVATGEHDRAIADLSKAIEFAVKDTSDLFYVARADAWTEAGQHDRAIQDLNEMITRQRPVSFLAYRRRGDAHAAKGRDDLAIQDYDSALANASSIEPTIVYLHRGRAHERRGDRERAIADYRAALVIAPWDDKIRSKLKDLGALSGQDR